MAGPRRPSLGRRFFGRTFPCLRNAWPGLARSCLVLWWFLASRVAIISQLRHQAAVLRPPLPRATMRSPRSKSSHSRGRRAPTACRPRAFRIAKFFSRLRLGWPRAKRLPERPGPRGAKDSIRFRERFDDSGRLFHAGREGRLARAVGRMLSVACKTSEYRNPNVESKSAHALSTSNFFRISAALGRRCIEAFGRIHATETAPVVRRIESALPRSIPMQTHPLVDTVWILCLVNGRDCECEKLGHPR